MSILFGIRQAEEHAVEEYQMRCMGSRTARYAPDGTYLRVSGRIGMGFQAYHTHQRSQLERQPVVNAGGDMLTFDGRLDNSAELCSLLGLKHQDTPDSLIVLASFAHWEAACFSRFVGDWALALWISAVRSLYLARDHAGTRTLYFELGREDVLWATHLESLLWERSDRSLDEAFVAAYLSDQPIGDLTPYRNIRAVSPAHYVVIQERKLTRMPHWVWMVREWVHYGSDAEYDEHFLSLFRQSVDRRTGSGAPVLAELSGGVDSSSIVCMSDCIRKAQGGTPADLIDTVSYYDDSEPNWNEKPYFTAVEQARGKRGLHIAVSARKASFEPPPVEYLWPGPDGGTLLAEERFEDKLAPGQYRVILSGIGGDQLLGGPPDPLPELADYFVLLKVHPLLSRSLEWGLAKRLPFLHLLRDSAILAVRLCLLRSQTSMAPPAWLSGVIREHAMCPGIPGRCGWKIGLLPSSIEHGLSWWSILETLCHSSQRLLVRREHRYPYLDRDLADFLLRLPPHQLMGPGRRRLLMRRALRNIVPSEVLDRRRKAYVARGPAVVLEENKSKLLSLINTSELKHRGYIDENRLEPALAHLGAPSSGDRDRHLMRAIQLELWIRRMASNDVLTHSAS